MVPTLRNIPEERRSHLYRSENLKSHVQVWQKKLPSNHTISYNFKKYATFIEMSYAEHNNEDMSTRTRLQPV